MLRHASLPHFYLLATPTDHLPDLDLFTDKLDSFEKMCSAEESEGGAEDRGPIVWTLGLSLRRS